MASRAGRTYKRDGNGRFASTGGGGSKRPAAKRVAKGPNRLTRDNSGKITSVGGDGATVRGGRLKTASGKLRARQTARVKAPGAKAGTIAKGGRGVSGAVARSLAAVQRKKAAKIKDNTGKHTKSGKSKAATAKPPSPPKLNGRDWDSLGRLRGVVPFSRGKGQAGYFVPNSSLTPARRRKLGLDAFKTQVDGGNFAAQRQTQGSQEGWIISPRAPRGEISPQLQRRKSSRKPKTADDLLTQATRIEQMGRRMSRAARTGARDRQIEERAVRAAKRARQRAFGMQKPPSKAELKRRESWLNAPTTSALNARLAADYAARNRP